MQKQMEETQAALEEKEYEATAGGGVITVKINGKKEITEVKIDPEAVDPDDVEMLQDLIVTCLNQAFKQVDDAQAASMGKYNIPGLM